MTKASKKRKDLPTSAPTGRNGGSRGSGAWDERGNPAPSTKKAKSEKSGLHGVPGSKNDSRRCTATAHRTGERCKAPAIKGGTVCRVHGGAAKQVRKSARERLIEMVEPAIAELHRIIENKKTSDTDKLRAVGMVLDRTGYAGGVDLNIHTTPKPTAWQVSNIAALGGVIDVQHWAETGEVRAPEAKEPAALELEWDGWEPEADEPTACPRCGFAQGGGDDSAGQIAYDMQQENWRDLDAEDAEPYTTKLDPYDGNTVCSEAEVISDEIIPRPVPPEPEDNPPPKYGRE